MGYYITLRDINFLICAEKKEEALRLFKENMLARVDDLGRGGHYENGGKSVSWFSWTNNDVLQAATTIEEVLTEFGWDPEVDEEGNIEGLDFGNEKIGQEELLFDAICPCVRIGSYIEVEGEDGNLWRWVFNGYELERKIARIIWD